MASDAPTSSNPTPVVKEVEVNASSPRRTPGKSTRSRASGSKSQPATANGTDVAGTVAKPKRKRTNARAAVGSSAGHRAGR